MPLTRHPAGNYRFLPGIAPYSCGAVSVPGYEIVHATFQRPPAYREGFERVAAFLQTENRPKASLCGVELRSPRPYTFQGFADFNAEYAEILKSWGVLADGVNPVARTNVAPAVNPPVEPVMYAFSYSRPCADDVPTTFVVAGGGELPEGVLSREGIVSLGDLSPTGLASKARFVMDLMENRLIGLGVDWSQVAIANVYAVHSIAPLLPKVILGRMGTAAIHGVHWHFSRPPIEEIEYEMDLRGTHTDLRLP